MAFSTARWRHYLITSVDIAIVSLGIASENIEDLMTCIIIIIIMKYL